VNLPVSQPAKDRRASGTRKSQSRKRALDDFELVKI